MLDSVGIKTTIDRAEHTVLVVDDNAVTRYSTSRILRASGFQVTEAGSGGEALQMAADGVSAVVLDVHLPDMNGFEVCGVLRHRPDTSLLPIIHLSAEFVRNEDRVAGLNAGADAYLVHPVEPAVLVATLQALIRARTAEESMRRSELRFRAVFDQALSGIVLIDEEGRIADANPAMFALLGRPRDAVVGQRLSDLAPPEWHERIRDRTRAAAADSQPWRGEFPLLSASGLPVHFEWSMSAHVEPGLRIGIATDISQRIELERRRREILEREQAGRILAEKHNRTKDDFIAVLSHELRTPLNAIVGWVAILMRRNPTPDAIKGLVAIERNVKTQARIISDILDVSRINSGKLRLECEPTDPADLIMASIDALREQIEARRIVVRANVDSAHAQAWIDPARFQQIFWNLMTNAVKFSTEGGEVQVDMRREGDWLELTVTDHGQGIDAAFLPRLFDRFSQSASPGNRRHGGLGLGLSIVQHLAELHGGTVEANSEGAGLGTTVTVRVPVLQRASDEVLAASPSPSRHSGEDSEALTGLDVLVVEDDADASEMLSVVLADRGASVRTAKDYESALRAAALQWPDVLVSDVGLPGRDGHELIRELRRREAGVNPGPRMPAIALTAFARPEDQAKAFTAGFDAHLTKPMKPHALVGMILSLRDKAAGRHP